MIRNIFSIATVASILLFSSCESEKKEVVKLVRPVKSLVIGDIGDTAKKGFPGVTKESKNSEISFRVGGPITKYNVVEGEKVTKGALIAQIDPRDYKVTSRATKARLDQTKSESDRFYRLWKKGSVSKNAYERRYANYLEAKATWQDAQNGLNDTKLYAPFTGFFGPKLVEIGQEVRRKQAVATIIDLSKIEVVTTIPEQLAVQLLNFDTYQVILETYPNIVFKATLKELEKTPTAEGFRLHLYLAHKNKSGDKSQIKVAAGMSCKVNLTLKKSSSKKNKIIIPLAAILEGKGDKNASIWIITANNTVKKQNVSTGALVGHDAIEITKGLSVGEKIVIAGVHRLSEGDMINNVDILKTN